MSTAAVAGISTCISLRNCNLTRNIVLTDLPTQSEKTLTGKRFSTPRLERHGKS